MGQLDETRFDATVQASEEAVVNAMVAAETMTGANYRRAYAIPHEPLRALLRKYNRLSERPGLLAGAIAVQLGRYGRAEQAFRQVLDRDHRNLTATISLAGLASHAGRRAEAVALLRHALVLAPGDQTATTELAVIHKQRLDPRQVADDLVANAAARVH